MNWYIIVSIVSSFLLGWSIGIWFGSSKGYEVAMEEQQALRSQEIWAQYLNSFNSEEETHEEE